MSRSARAAFAFSLLAIAGVVLVLLGTGWLLVRISFAAEEARIGQLAQALGERTEHLLGDAQQTLARLDALPGPRCGAEHLRAMQDEAIPRPHIRSIGYWRADERRCGVGFVEPAGLRPPRADRIYPSGVIAWWPSAQTEVGGVRLFLMRYGDHDIALDPGMLLETGPLSGRHAALWVEGLRLAVSDDGLQMPSPASVPTGLTIDRANNRLISRYTRESVLPIDIVAVEPIERFWGRRLPAVLAVVALGVLAVVGWVVAVLRYSRHRLGLESRLGHAVDKGRIQVHYQPIMDMQTGACVGAEALARWEVEHGVWISPEVFIPLAERSGLITRLTLAVLARVIDEVGDLLRAADGIAINLNLASQDLVSDDFADTLAIRLDTAGVAPSRIKLEITERALVDDAASRSTLAKLRGRGHRLVADDFGTGYSSLSYLGRLELDALKIDKSFVDGIGTGSVAGGVIVHIINMAASLGLGTVAEGIETTGQVDWLVDHGVRQGQGYLYSRPLMAAQLRDFLAARAAKHAAPAHAGALPDGG